MRATSHLHKASGVLIQGRSAPLQTHRVQMPQKLAEEPRLTLGFGRLGERKSENHENAWKTRLYIYISIIYMCI